MTSKFTEEKGVFEKNLETWIAEGKTGKAVIIAGHEVVGFFDDEATALDEAHKKFGETLAFVRLVLPKDSTNTTFMGRLIEKGKRQAS